MGKTPFEYLENKIFNGEWLSDNHNNYTFLEFWDLFCNAETFEVAKRRFHYYCGKLVKSGMCKKHVAYNSGRDISNIGRRTIINYQPIIVKK